MTGPFATRSHWQITAVQGPPMPDPVGLSDAVPGAIAICLRRRGGPCDEVLQSKLFDTPDFPAMSGQHYLDALDLVRAHGTTGQQLLRLVTASLHSIDGDQLVLTQVLAYGRGTDRFAPVYEHSTGTNNNQEVRFMGDGPLAGDIVSAEPTTDAPFGYWVTVNAFVPGRGYRAVLRFRSATTYGDGNRLPVIDSEMPSILRHLGRWRPGSPLPLPAGPCAKPRLRRGELWCD